MGRSRVGQIIWNGTVLSLPAGGYFTSCKIIVKILCNMFMFTFEFYWLQNIKFHWYLNFQPSKLFCVKYKHATKDFTAGRITPCQECVSFWQGQWCVKALTKFWFRHFANCTVTCSKISAVKHCRPPNYFLSRTMGHGYTKPTEQFFPPTRQLYHMVMVQW